ncbi:polyphenol oxidase family protein [Candidatus Saccharibacteria bacterium TM7i]|nr:polyphenol oxidase family protein [Candidatus Saccharibacteria bacterium TM7i]
MNVRILVSTVADGSMKSTNGDFAEVIDNRRAFLGKHGLKPEDATLLHVVYEGDDYCRYVETGEADRGDGIIRVPTIDSDALLTRQPGQVLLLPVADCAPLVLFDETMGVLMLSHLGRHSAEQEGGRKSVEYFLAQSGTSPASVKAWLGPAAGKDGYPLWAFDNRGLHEVIVEQLLATGLRRDQIEVSPADTTTDSEYYSHSNFLKGLQGEVGDGRFAVAAVIEP